MTVTLIIFSIIKTSNNKVNIYCELKCLIYYEAFFYNLIENNFLKHDDFNQNYVKEVSGFITPSLSPYGTVENNNIKYVMKHKVIKKLYEIKVNGKSVKVTEDHSIIVKNKKTNKIHSVKPDKLSCKNHYIIYIMGADTDSNAENYGL
jgi:hypothetical protein